ncbi:MAG: DUF4328 domain-containing protein [Ilumatobacter sp.]
MGAAFPPPSSPGTSGTSAPSSGTPLPPPPPSELTRPTAYAAYRPEPATTGTLSRVGGLGRWVTWLVGVAGAAGVLSAILLLPVVGTASDVIDGRADLSEFEDAYVPVQLVQTVQSVVGIAAGVITIVWMYRIASNLRAFARDTTFAPFLSVFAWILPPFLYVLPFLVLRELWTASDPTVEHGSDAWKNRKVSPLLSIWFVVYGLVPAVITAVVAFDAVDSILSNGIAGAGDPQVVAESLASTGMLTVVSGGLAAVAAITWIVFARRLTDRHMAMTGEEAA